MEQSSFYNYFAPTTKNEADYFHKRNLFLLYLLKEKVSYPTEIARNLDLSIDTINELIYKCLKDELVQKFTPNPDNLQRIFKSKIYELWARGITSYGQIFRFSWWSLSPIGFEFLKAKHKGERLQISEDLAEYLGATFQACGIEDIKSLACRGNIKSFPELS